MLFCRASLPLPRQTLNFAAGIIRRHRISIGSLWRKLNPGQQALLVLVYLRKGETFASLAAGFRVGTATAWRYAGETVALLAARAPRLHPDMASLTVAIKVVDPLWSTCTTAGRTRSQVHRRFDGQAVCRFYVVPSFWARGPQTPLPGRPSAARSPRPDPSRGSATLRL